VRTGLQSWCSSVAEITPCVKLSPAPRCRLNSEACARKGQAIVFAGWRCMNVLIGGGCSSWKVFGFCGLCGQCCGSRGGMERCSFPSRREKRVPHVSPITSDAARSLPPCIHEIAPCAPHAIPAQEAAASSLVISENHKSKARSMGLKLHTRPTLMASVCDVSGCGVTGGSAVQAEGSVVSVWKGRREGQSQAGSGSLERQVPPVAPAFPKLRPDTSHLASTLNQRRPPSTSTPHTGHVARLNLHGLLLPDTNCCWTSIDADRACGRPSPGGMGRLSWTVARPMPPNPT
jgi:hypothetical protein